MLLFSTNRLVGGSGKQGKLVKDSTAFFLVVASLGLFFLFLLDLVGNVLVGIFLDFRSGSINGLARFVVEDGHGNDDDDDDRGWSCVKMGCNPFVFGNCEWKMIQNQAMVGGRFVASVEQSPQTLARKKHVVDFADKVSRWYLP